MLSQVALSVITGNVKVLSQVMLSFITGSIKVLSQLTLRSYHR